MQENWNDSELHLLVTSTRRDGRRRYDPKSKHALAKACLQPGVSLAGMALKHGVNANLLRKWVVIYRSMHESSVAAITPSSADAFVPVVIRNKSTARHATSKPTSPPSVYAAQSTPGSRLRAQLPNGVTFELDCTDRDATLLSNVIETLGRCDVPSRR